MLVQACWHCVRLISRGQWSAVAYLLQVKWRGLDLKWESVSETGADAARANWHSDSGGPALDRVLKKLPIAPSDEAIDIGCGKGGAILTLAKYPFARVDGLEISERLIEIARENLRRMGVANSVLFRGDAAEFADYDRYTFLYMYNPFPREVMKETMRHVAESLRRRPRRVTLLYKNAKDHALVEEAGFLKVAEFADPESRCPTFVYSAGA